MSDLRSFSSAAAILLLTACGGGASSSPPGLILSFTQGAIDQQTNTIKGIAISPQPICKGGAFPVDSNTLYEWAPVVPSSSVPGRPTVDEQQFIAGGFLERWVPPGEDIMFAHPFGADYSMDVSLNPVGYLYLNYVKPGGGNTIPLHVEIESGLFPYQDFGWGVPLDHGQDAVLVKGDWILDCGHPSAYGSEIHPPSFLAFAHQKDSQTTEALAFASPYRTTQLYNSNEKLAYDFANYKRFSDPDTKAFPDHEMDEVTKVVELQSNNLEAHAMVEPTDFGNVSWNVCAPGTRPAESTLDYTYHFTARTGVGLQAIPNADTGCVQFIAVEGPAFSAAPQKPNVVTWSWSEINKAASDQAGKPTDVKAIIYDRLHQKGLYLPYIGIENDPKIDSYPALHPRPGASAEGPIGVTAGADDQPFPFYGRARVAWKTNPAVTPASTLVANPSQLSWYPNVSSPLAATVTNSATGGGGSSYSLAKVTISGPAAGDYSIQSDSCSSKVLKPSASCTVVVIFKPSAAGSRDAVLSFPDKGGTVRLLIPLAGPGFVS